MADSAFWRDLAAEFLALPDPHGELRADGHYIVGSGRPWEWALTGGAREFIRTAFTALAKRGAAEIASVDTADLLGAWLEALSKDGSSFRLQPGLGTEVNADGSAGSQHILGSIYGLREASATLCRKLESDAIQVEFEEKQQNDPRNWSPLHRQVEAFKELKKLITGPPLHIPEGLVRDALAQQFGIKPEEVTWKQIQFEVSGLLPYYPAISVVPALVPPGPKVESTPPLPTAFISYSWDAPELKEWVLRLAERLQAEGGVKVVLDRWNLGPGEDRTYFMEESIRTSDFVLVVCTPGYAMKANDRAGGVGYEAMIITSQIAQRIQQNKFIPVLRSGNWDDSSVPIWIQSKIGVDLRGDPYKENEYDLLLRALHRSQLKPPPIGPKPVFSERGDSFSGDLACNAVSALLESRSNSAGPPLTSTSGGNEDRPKLSPVAYAFYETKGADARRVQTFVRPTDTTRQRFRFEASTGATLEGTDIQVAQQYLAFDLDLRQKGFSRMQTFDGFSGPIFRLP